MTLKLIPQVPHLLLATGLFLGMAAAQAAGGFTVSPDQETLIKPGMNTVQVQLAIGRAAQNRLFANEPGPTWTYRVAGQEQTVFDVDFGADGRVVSASERLDESGRAHGARG